MTGQGGTLWTGGCLCGALRYQSTGAPERVVHCHCGMCRRASGAAFLTLVGFKAEDFTWTQGAPAIYRSSRQAERGFCRRCGSTMSYHLSTENWRSFVALGSLDRPEAVAPEEHCFADAQLPWLHLDDGLPRLPRGRFAHNVEQEQ